MDRCILFSYAHPDDESFAGVGTAMKYAASGARVVLLTATRGERGSPGTPPVCAPEDIGACREAELRAAAAIAGLDELHLLGYRDRELADAPREEVRRALVSHLRRVRPTVVVTFDPNGYNAHPDHVAISRFTSDALSAAADARWYPDLGPAHAVPRLLWTPPLAPWNVTTFDALHDTPGADFVVDVSPWRERRIAALRAHRTQHVSVEKHFFDRPHADRILGTEIWRHAWGPAPIHRPGTDIMEGL
jgi:LmbE family N-acetylglucosaminyl deacetylase